MLHLHFLKGTLGVKRSTTNRAVLRECGHEPMHFYWFRSAVKLFNCMFNTKSDTIDPPSSDTMLALVAEQIGKMNGRFSGTAWV